MATVRGSRRPQERDVDQLVGVDVHDQRRFDFYLRQLDDAHSECRKRMDAENIYTAASIGSFGAACWGVATLGTATNRGSLRGWTSPILVVCVGVVLVTVVVVMKIVREHRHYMSARSEQVRIAALVGGLAAIEFDALPPHLRAVGRGGGYLRSIVLVISCAVATILFCISVYLSVPAH